MVERDKPHPVRCARLLRQQAPQEGWPLDQLAERIHLHCGHSWMRSHRLAHGWTLERLVDEINAIYCYATTLTPSRVSRWELGTDQPSGRYRDALCRVYRTGPVELGLGQDYGATRSSRPASKAGRELIAGAAEQEDDVRRRAMIRDALAVGVGLATTAVVEKAAELRQRMDETLAGSTLSDATVAHKEKVADQYGRVYKTQPVVDFLPNILADFNEVQGLTNRRLPSSQRRDLCAVTARLAGLVSMVMVNIGEYREAREWVHTARLAADEGGAPDLRAWVATRGAVAHLHFGDPAAAAVAAHEAEVLTRHHPCSATAMAWAVIARAAAVGRNPRVARHALRRAEDLFPSAGDPDGISAYTFTEGQLHFYASHALTSIGETRAAREAQDAALAAFSPGEVLDPTLVQLDRALCMIQEGDAAGGTDYAATVLLGLAAEYRPPIVLRRAAAIAIAVPANQRNLPTVRNFHDVLALGPGPTGTPPPM